MKTVSRTEKKALENTSGHESLALSIDASALVHIMGVLTNLYSKPQLAVLREYVSNAVDSQAKTGVTTPIDVTLPSFSKGNMLIVRDYGEGMDKEDVTNVYSRYGTSTKRDDNDAIGGFGLGAKSALAISDRFDVVSIKNGVRLEFYVEKNAQGAGLLYFVSEEETDEPSGVEVRVPYGHFTFNDTDVPEFFVGFPSGTLRIDGKLSDMSLDNPEKFVPILGITNEDNAGWYEVAPKGNRHHLGLSESVFAVIGGVKYQIQDSWLAASSYSYLRSFGRRVFIDLPIGSVELTPSREELNYSEKTKNILDVSLKNFENSLASHLTAMLNRAKTHLEAIELKYEITDMGYSKASNLTWRGKSVPLELDTEKVSAIVTSTSGYSGTLKNVSTLNDAGYPYNYRSYFSKNLSLVVMNDGQMKESALTVRRNARVIREMTGKHQIILLDKKDYDNVWYSFTHNVKYTTVTELVAAAKAYAREVRLRMKAENSDFKAPSKKRVVAYFMSQNEDGRNQVERVYAKDERLAKLNEDKTVYYMKQERSHGMFPWFSFDDEKDIFLLSARDNTRGLMNFAKKLVGDVPIFLLTSRASLDKFIAEYPSAKEIEPLIRAYAVKTHVPAQAFTFNDILNKLTSDYSIRAKAQRLTACHGMLVEKKLIEKITNESFLEVGKWENWGKEVKKSSKHLTTEEKAALELAVVEEENLQYWAGYSRNSDEDLNDTLVAYSKHVAEITENFFLITSLSDTALAASTDKLNQVVEYINIVATEK